MRDALSPMKLTLSIILLFAATAFAQSTGEAKFVGVKAWESALRANNAITFQSVYSSNPPAAFIGDDKKPHAISEDIAFWQEFRASHPGFKLIERESEDLQGLHVVALTLSFLTHTPQGLRPRYIFVTQGWQHQGDNWKILLAKHTGVSRMPQPTVLDTDIYPSGVDAKAEIRDAVAQASRGHKHILLIFGANWCYDCHVLDYVLKQPQMAKLVQPNFIIVHVDIGEGKLNNDIAAKYDTPLSHGVPVLAVLDSSGKVLYSQQNGEFENARAMDPDTLTAFLNHWKP